MHDCVSLFESDWNYAIKVDCGVIGALQTLPSSIKLSRNIVLKL